MAQVSMHQREYTVALRPQGPGLMLHSLFYANEVRAVSEYGGQNGAEVKAQELEMAEKLIEALAKPFEPEGLKDEYQARLLQLVESKTEGHAVAETPHKRLSPVVDLMTALQQSLSGGDSQRKPPTKQRKPIPISEKKKAAG